ncbi:hypothetical protein TB1_010170 [Malus domestica]
MDYIDVPIICLTFVTYLAGQSVMAIQQDERRAKLAIQQREDYFARLTQETNQTDEETTVSINKLRGEKERLLHNLSELDVDPNYPDDVECDEEEFEKVVTRLKGARDKLDGRIDEISKESGISLAIDLDRSIRQLIEGNRNLYRKLQSRDLPLLSASPAKLDQDLLQYSEEHMDKLHAKSLDDLYEKFLEIDLHELDKYLPSESNYETDIVELDRRRVKAGKRLETQAKERYQDELNTFNETRLEYLFKSAGTRELLDVLKEKDNILEMINQNLNEDLMLKRAEQPKSNHDL